MVKCNFSKATITIIKAYYLALKEMFSILALSFLSKNMSVFTTYKQRGIKREYYLEVTIHWF